MNNEITGKNIFNIPTFVYPHSTPEKIVEFAKVGAKKCLPIFNMFQWKWLSEDLSKHEVPTEDEIVANIISLIKDVIVVANQYPDKCYIKDLGRISIAYSDLKIITLNIQI